jgi:SAM-dependent methyltransferase
MVSNYVFDDAWLEERSRLGSLEAALDPGAIRHLISLGVGPGWNCLEVGAGAGSIASWLCQRVGSRGHVVACDLQTAFLQNLNRPNLDVWQHDIVIDTLPERRFDLVHVRWTLHWPPCRRRLDDLRPAPRWLAAGRGAGLRHPLLRVRNRCGDPGGHPGGAAARNRQRRHGQPVRTQAPRRSGHPRPHRRPHRGQGPPDSRWLTPSGATWLRFTVDKVADRLLSSGAVTEAELHDTVRLLQDPLSPPTAP